MSGQPLRPFLLKVCLRILTSLATSCRSRRVSNVDPISMRLPWKSPASLSEATPKIYPERRYTLNELTSIFDDPDSMEYEIEDLRRLASRYQIDGALEAAFANARERVEEYRNPPLPDEDYSPRDAARAFAPDSNSEAQPKSLQQRGREDREIDNWFLLL